MTHIVHNRGQSTAESMFELQGDKTKVQQSEGEVLLGPFSTGVSSDGAVSGQPDPKWSCCLSFAISETWLWVRTWAGSNRRKVPVKKQSSLTDFQHSRCWSWYWAQSFSHCLITFHHKCRPFLKNISSVFSLPHSGCCGHSRPDIHTLITAVSPSFELARSHMSPFSDNPWQTLLQVNQWLPLHR